jgi:hypothetical protein
MIINIDPYYVPPFQPASNTPARATPASNHSTHASRSHISPSLAEREARFEQEYGSLWEHDLLDRLTTPLTRYHD